MKISTLLAVLAVAVLPALGISQSLKDRLKVHKGRLPRPSHRLLAVHPRRLAVNQKGGRRQVRFLSAKQNHKVRTNARTVTHRLTKPHRHVGSHKKS